MCVYVCVCVCAVAQGGVTSWACHGKAKLVLLRLLRLWLIGWIREEREQLTLTHALSLRPRSDPCRFHALAYTWGCSICVELLSGCAIAQGSAHLAHRQYQARYISVCVPSSFLYCAEHLDENGVSLVLAGPNPAGDAGPSHTLVLCSTHTHTHTHTHTYRHMYLLSYDHLPIGCTYSNA